MCVKFTMNPFSILTNVKVSATASCMDSYFMKTFSICIMLRDDNHMHFQKLFQDYNPKSNS